ncbi:MAG: isoleucine--tRNA ligase [Candidatus Hepatoplasma vulgare]|nr:MAG: isoleucine--tRNA ligase [Candidatus Hepatoplasma sp.]
MPKTNFEMKGDLFKKDQYFFKKNIEIDLINKLKNRDGYEFILHDGPPYANGDIHLGHALNKILKDIIIRREILNGSKLNAIPGWDTFGLPIETEIQKSGINLKNTEKEIYLKKCYSYALKQVERQEKQFKKLNLLFDFENKYLTLKNDYIANEIKIFHKMLNDKLIYQSLKPIYWSYSSKTALAEAEIEYKKSKDDSCYVAFKFNNSLNILIWTTTPWTLPGNVALAFNKNIKYKITEIENKKYVIAEELILKLEKKINKKIKILEDFNLEKNIGKDAINPLNKDLSRLIYGDHVTTESGTGIVHTAGGHGMDDYLVTKENNLRLFVVTDDDGNMINSKEYDGIFYKKANNIILNDLTKKGALLFSEEITHSIPIDWRTKLPIIYRATKQWFVSIEKIKNDLLNNIEKVTWIPSWGKNKIKEMVINRDDWCISRQRIWGVPIPIIYDEKSKPIVNKKLQENIENLFNEKGIIGWRDANIKDLLPKEIKFNEKFKKETDILDVWFDSGSSHLSVLKGKMADIYLEGNDQYRGWFNSSLITKTILENKAPYKKVITHGFTVDENGNKMSKSLGNVINPIEFIERYGSDILRFWVANSDYFSNLKFSKEIVENNIKAYKKIRNSLKYILGNISDLKKVYKEEYSFLGKMMLSNLIKLQNEIEENYKNYKFSNILKRIVNEVTSESLAYYFEYVKDVIYIERKNSSLRREAQTILNYAFKILIYALSPILPVTIEDAYENYHLKENNESIFLAKKELFDFKENNNWEIFNKIREELNKKIEELRVKKILNRSFEAEVNITLGEKYQILANENLKDLLLVGKINLFFTNEKDTLEISIKKYNGIRCERCWKYYSQEEMIDDICERCSNVIKETPYYIEIIKEQNYKEKEE